LKGGFRVGEQGQHRQTTKDRQSRNKAANNVGWVCCYYFLSHTCLSIIRSSLQ